MLVDLSICWDSGFEWDLQLLLVAKRARWFGAAGTCGACECGGWLDSLTWGFHEE